MEPQNPPAFPSFLTERPDGIEQQKRPLLRGAFFVLALLEQRQPPENLG
jgi:hypothetical protein